MSIKDVNVRADKMRTESLSKCLYLGDDKESADYLKEACSVCISYVYKQWKPYDYHINIRDTAKDIITISDTDHYMLNPNDPEIYNMIHDGNSLESIWKYKMHPTRRGSIRYISPAAEDALIPRIPGYACGRRLGHYNTLAKLNRNKGKYTFNQYVTCVVEPSHVYEFLLKLLIELVLYHDPKVIGMIDVLQEGMITRTLNSVYAYIKDVIMGYCWCDIYSIFKDALFDGCIKYRDRLVPMLSTSILSIMYYSNIDNIPDTINGKDITHYLNICKTESEWMCRYENVLTYLKGTTTWSDDPVVFAEHVRPILSEDSYPIMNDTSIRNDIKCAYNGAEDMPYHTIYGVFKSICDNTWAFMEEGGSDGYLRVYNPVGDQYLTYVPTDILKKPHLMLKEFVPAKLPDDDEDAKEKRVPISLDITRGERMNTAAMYSDAKQKSPKYPINPFPMRSETVTAFYDEHTVSIPKSVMEEHHITRRVEFDEDFYKPTNVRYKMNVNQIADIADRTLGFAEFDMYNTNPGGDIDRSSWEPRRNNWTLTH